MTKEEQVLALAEVTREMATSDRLFYNKEAKRIELKRGSKTFPLSNSGLSEKARDFWRTVTRFLQDGVDEESLENGENLTHEVAGTLGDGAKYSPVELEDCVHYVSCPPVFEVWLTPQERTAVKEVSKYGRLVKSISVGDLAFCPTTELSKEENQKLTEWMKIIEDCLDEAVDLEVEVAQISPKILRYQESLLNTKPVDRKVRRTSKTADFLRTVLRLATESTATTALPVLCWGSDGKTLMIKNGTPNKAEVFYLELTPSGNKEFLTRLLDTLVIMDARGVNYQSEPNIITANGGTLLDDNALAELTAISKNTGTPLGREILELAQWLRENGERGIPTSKLENWLYE